MLHLIVERIRPVLIISQKYRDLIQSFVKPFEVSISAALFISDSLASPKIQKTALSLFVVNMLFLLFSLVGGFYDVSEGLFEDGG